MLRSGPWACKKPMFTPLPLWYHASLYEEKVGQYWWIAAPRTSAASGVHPEAGKTPMPQFPLNSVVMP